MTKGAYDGITVLDFTQGVAGPHATMLLALHGADVIKIEPPEGDWGRALGELKGDHCAHSVAFNRGKRSIALDLKSADGKAAVNRLMAKANVIVESFRPGVISRLGFGYEDAPKVNPSVVYCSVSGFGQTGPYEQAADRRRPDPGVQRHDGDEPPPRRHAVASGHDRGRRHDRPLHLPGAGAGVDAPAPLQRRLLHRFQPDASAAAYQGAKLMEYVFSKGTPPPLYMPAGSYKSKNGYIMVSAMRPHHFRLLFELIGRQDIADDPDLQGHNDRIRNAAKIIKALNETMPTKTTEEWIAILQPKDVFCERVNNYTDYLNHPHVKESGAIDWIEQDGFGRMPVANIPGLPPASAARRAAACASSR